MQGYRLISEILDGVGRFGGRHVKPPSLGGGM
jgi:hypothetical protein